MGRTKDHRTNDPAVDRAVAVARELAEAARAEGRVRLDETEGLEIAAALGVGVPARRVVTGADRISAADLDALPGERVVVKVVSPEIAHKNAAGGVRTVAREVGAVTAAVAEMERRFADRRVVGYGLFERVEHPAGAGGELLLGVRWTADFGPVVTCGPGGVDAELLAAHLRPGSGAAILSPELGSDPERIGELLADRPFLAAGAPELATVVARFLAFAEAALPELLDDLEINPLVFADDTATRDGRPVALDALATVGRGASGDGEPEVPSRPLHKLRHLLEPRSMAVVGVSEKMNPGRILLRNTLERGFDRGRIVVVKPGSEEIDGCRSVPDLASLPEPVDLLVLAVGAAQVPGLMAEVIEQRSAESVILIPGGLGERSGSEGHVERLHAALADARRSEWGGPLVNGGNCLGIRSAPGRYDTLFIPRHKLRFPDADPAPLAVVAQSGAFAVSRASKLDDLDPRYLVSIGNQLDLTVGDYLEHLADDPELRVIACYVEGFRPGDGRRWLRAAARFVDRGGTAVLYRAGRTAAGARASASHTASIAGDYAVTRELAAAAGVLLADSLADFEALVRLAVALDGKRPAGDGKLRLGAVSNAGFECVAVADNLGPFRLAPFAGDTRGRLGELFRSRRVDAIVEVHNPLDLTPVLDDEAFEEASRAVLDDPNVDLGVIGCVPLTGALQTLPAGAGHGEDLTASDSVVERLLRLRHHPKPWVAVVDAGPLYDPMAHRLAAGGVATFRTVDRALRLLAEWCRGRGA